MGFTAAVQWWEEWQLRILVLASLFIQLFLFFAASLRKYSIPAWFRFMIWLAYLGSDAVAIYALAVLFNRQNRQEWVSTHRSSYSLQVLWAPILLVHLGGQDGITAYNIEDNELWTRHVLTAVSQGMRSSLGAISAMLQQPPPCSNRPMNPEALQADRDESFRVIRIWKPYDLLVDLTPAYSARFKYLKYLLRHPSIAHLLVRCGLSGTFDRLYTKKWLELPGSPAEPSLSELDRRGFTWWCTLDGIIFHVRLAMASTLVICLVLFLKSNKQAYNQTDVKITFALLYPPATIDLVLPLILPFIRTIKFVCYSPPWPDHVAQYNLIGYLARNRKHWILRKLPTFVKDFIDQLWCMKPYKSSSGITELVANHVTAGWWQIHDIASYHRFNDSRGQWTLGCEGLLDALGWSLNRPFDESLLIWHLATDLFCFHHMGMGMGMTTPSSTQQRQAACRSGGMSNYMAYLLFVNPEMLIAGARRSLFKDTYEELEGIIQPDGGQPLLGGQEEPASSIIRRLRETENSGSGVAHDAWAVTQVLIGLHVGEDVDKVWRVVQGVWVEMLCFSAGRCRGYLHAKSMGSGGQYLSYVWLLLSYMGMETLAEKMQRTDLDEGRHEAGAGTGTTTVPRSAVPASPTDGDRGSVSPTQAQAVDPTSGSPPTLSPIQSQRSTSHASAARAGDNIDVVITID